MRADNTAKLTYEVNVVTDGLESIKDITKALNELSTTMKPNSNKNGISQLTTQLKDVSKSLESVQTGLKDVMSMANSKDISNLFKDEAIAKNIRNGIKKGLSSVDFSNVEGGFDKVIEKAQGKAVKGFSKAVKDQQIDKNVSSILDKLALINKEGKISISIDTKGLNAQLLEVTNAIDQIKQKAVLINDTKINEQIKLVTDKLVAVSNIKLKPIDIPINDKALNERVAKIETYLNNAVMEKANQDTEQPKPKKNGKSKKNSDTTKINAFSTTSNTLSKAKEDIEKAEKIGDTKMIAQSAENISSVSSTLTSIKNLIETINSMTVAPRGDARRLNGVQNSLRNIEKRVAELDGVVAVQGNTTKGTIDVKNIEQAIEASMELQKYLEDIVNSKSDANLKKALKASRKTSKELSAINERTENADFSFDLQQFARRGRKSSPDAKKLRQKATSDAQKNVLYGGSAESLKGAIENIDRAREVENIVENLTKKGKDKLQKQKAKEKAQSLKNKYDTITKRYSQGTGNSDIENTLAKNLMANRKVMDAINNPQTSANALAREYATRQKEKQTIRDAIAKDENSRQKAKRKEYDNFIKEQSGYLNSRDKEIAEQANREILAKNKLIKAEQEYITNIDRQNASLNRGVKLTQDELDAMKRLNQESRQKIYDLGGDLTKLPKARVGASTTLNELNNEADRNRARNAIAWSQMQNISYSGAISDLRGERELTYRRWKTTGSREDLSLLKSQNEEIRKLNESMKQYSNIMANADDADSRFFGQLRRHMMWISTGVLLSALLAIPSQAVSTIKELDEAMHNLATVMPSLSHSTSEWNNEQSELIATASRYGASVNEIIESGRLWGRMYKDVATVNTMVAQSAKLAVADNFQLADATKAVEAVMFQYGMQAKSSAEALAYSNRIIDVFTKLSHNAGVSAQDLAQGVERSGTVAHQAGVDFEMLSALIATGTRATALSGQEIGNMLKTLLASFRSTKAIKELDKLGIKTKEVAEDGTERIRKAQDVLLEVALQAQTTDKDLQQLWMALSGGKFQWSKASAMLSDYSEIIKNWGMAVDSMGFTDKQVAEQMDSIARRVNSLKADFEGLVMNAGNGGLTKAIKDAVSTLDSWMKFLEKIPASVYDTAGSFVMLGIKIYVVTKALGLMKSRYDVLRDRAVIANAELATTGTTATATASKLATVGTATTATARSMENLAIATRITKASFVGLWTTIKAIASRSLIALPFVLAGEAVGKLYDMFDKANSQQDLFADKAVQEVAVNNQLATNYQKRSEFVSALLNSYEQLSEAVDSNNISDDKRAKVQKDLEETEKQLAMAMGDFRLADNQSAVDFIKNSDDKATAIKEVKDQYTTAQTEKRNQLASFQRQLYSQAMNEAEIAKKKLDEYKTDTEQFVKGNKEKMQSHISLMNIMYDAWKLSEMIHRSEAKFKSDRLSKEVERRDNLTADIDSLEAEMDTLASNGEDTSIIDSQISAKKQYLDGVNKSIESLTKGIKDDEDAIEDDLRAQAKTLIGEDEKKAQEAYDNAIKIIGTMGREALEEKNLFRDETYHNPEAYPEEEKGAKGYSSIEDKALAQQNKLNSLKIKAVDTDIKNLEKTFDTRLSVIKQDISNFGASSTSSKQMDRLYNDTIWSLSQQKPRLQSLIKEFTDNAWDGKNLIGEDYDADSNAGKLITALIQAGYTKDQAIGFTSVMGGIESGLNPNAVNPNSGAYGIGQWLGSRKDALFDYANRNGSDAGNLETQIAYLIEEMRSNEASSMENILNSGAQTPEEWAYAFAKYFERGDYEDDFGTMKQAYDYIDALREGASSSNDIDIEGLGTQGLISKDEWNAMTIEAKKDYLESNKESIKNADAIIAKLNNALTVSQKLVDLQKKITTMENQRTQAKFSNIKAEVEHEQKVLKREHNSKKAKLGAGITAIQTSDMETEEKQALLDSYKKKQGRYTDKDKNNEAYKEQQDAINQALTDVQSSFLSRIDTLATDAQKRTLEKLKTANDLDVAKTNSEYSGNSLMLDIDGNKNDAKYKEAVALQKRQIFGNYVDILDQARNDRENGTGIWENEAIAKAKYDEIQAKLENARIALATEKTNADLDGLDSHNEKILKLEADVNRFIGESGTAETDLENIRQANDNVMNQIVQKTQTAQTDMLNAEREATEARRKNLDTLKEKGAEVFTDLLLEGKSFKDIWKQMWKDIAKVAIMQLFKIRTTSSWVSALFGSFGLSTGGLVGGTNRSYTFNGTQASFDTSFSHSSTGGKLNFANGGNIPAFANGGNYIKGAGTGKSDSILAYLANKDRFVWLSNGEYVMTAEATKRIGKNNLDSMNYGKYAEGGSLANITTPTPYVPTINSDVANKATKINGASKTEQLLLEQNRQMQQQLTVLQNMRDNQGNGNLTVLSTQASSSDVLKALQENPRALQAILGRQSRMGFR